MATVHRLLPPSACRRNRRRFASPHGEPPRRRAQSRPDTHGRGVQHRQPRAAGLDGGLAHPRRDLCPGAPTSDQPAAARAARSDVWQRFCVLVGRPIFSGRWFRPRPAASIRRDTVTASLILRQLASYRRQNGLAAALRELGRLERTLFTLDWLEDRELRRQTGQELNKGESRNSLARAVFIHRLGEIRDRTYENQQHRASGLNLLVTAIILWNTRYLERAIPALRQAEDVPDQLLAHLSPLGWEHVNLTGDYIWSAERPATENSDGFRPLRAAPDAARKAA